MTNGPVALVGSPHDAHIAAVRDGLEKLDVDVVVVDTLSFPEQPAITLGERLDSISIDGRDTGSPAAVYFRDVYAQPLAVGVDAAEEMEQDWHRTLVAFREKAHMLFPLLGRWAVLGVPFYNPPASNWRHAKAMQLALLDRAGLPVPETIWTNDPQRVRSFAGNRRIAYKPVAGGAATRELGPDDLTDERLQSLRGAPVTFQELLEGENVRVYCLDGEVIATVRIVSQSLDYRQNEEVMERVELSADAAAQCLQATELLHMRWTGIDLKRDEAGNLKFLELNSSPMFLGFDRGAGTGILDALVGRLASHAGGAEPR
jgi:glutathione synthase/RimK-type ligase-like ATP-grasp enzyme